jgi:hypothetical protein
MTWMFQKNGYELFFNRDEAKTRLIAFPPKVHTVNRVSFIAPIDADAGGTWMGVNAFGVSVCLLNGYGHVDRDRADYVSRGALVMSLLDVSSGDAAKQIVADMDLTVFRPFSLVILEPEQPVLLWVWDGIEVRFETDISGPLISSSFRLNDVAEHRQRLYQHLDIQQTKALEDFHCNHAPEAGPYSVCMHRDDAGTVSLSRVVVSQELVDFYYAPGPPCKTEFQPPTSLPRNCHVRSANT